jgi:S-(hydroxymethyl)glutathione dehydrogenase/alcohol dehydrogenase
MKAAVLRALNDPLSVELITCSAPARGQVRVRIAATGVCHTQVNETRGRKGKDVYLPHLLGHEAAGVVEEIGPGVTRIAVGDHVVLTWIKGQGISAGGPSCTDGRGQTVNAGPIATFADMAVVSEDRATPIRKDVPLNLAALLGCAVATGAGAVFNSARLKGGETVAVFGTGGIGLNAIQAAVIAGASRVIAVDIVDSKLDRARVFGATDVINARGREPGDAILELTRGRGADVAIESAGQRISMEQAFASVRTGGGLAILVGNLPSGQSISIDPFQLICGKRIVGSWGGETNPGRDIPLYADMFVEGKLKLAELVSHRFRLDDINAALNALEKGEVNRALIEF